MARISRIPITLCTLPFTALPLTPMAHASEQVRESSATTHIIKKTDEKRSTATTQKVWKASQKTTEGAANESTTKNKTASSVKKSSIAASKNVKARSKHVVNKTASASSTEKYTKRRGYKSHCMKVKNAVSGTPADTYKAKMQKATKVAMNKLIQQIGKSYRWGGSSPRAGFDCSGLVYYVYKDLVKIHVPHTADEMYHLHDVTPTERNRLKNGDPVFFCTQGRGTANHVDVHVDSDKFIQSSHTGQEIRITSLSEDYWQRHYVGARRVITPKMLC